jgi:peptidoglycan hydrolase CwlO-like protein
MSKEKTIHELAQEFPNKTYVELEKYRNADRQAEAGVCIMGEMKKDREPESELDRIKRDNNDLYNRVAELIEINESHQKLNGKLQERLTELDEEVKKMHDTLEKRINGMRKSGM